MSSHTLSGTTVRHAFGADGTESTATISRAGGIAVAALRISLGFVFLWAFLDKTFGLGYATPAAKSWINGGSPTKGFLSGVAAGPMESTFHAWAGAAWADWLFMLGLLGIGVAVMLGIGLRISAVAGAIMMAMMWLAEWPLTQGSNNPLVDYHVIYALVLVLSAVLLAGDTWGLGRRWAKLPIVQRFTWLR